MAPRFPTGVAAAAPGAGSAASGRPVLVADED